MLEQEFKRLLSRKQYNRLRRMFRWEKTVRQTNYYYQDAHGELSSGRNVVRIRRINGRYLLQTKSQLSSETSIAIMEEKEKPIDRVPDTLYAHQYRDMINISAESLALVGSLATKRKIKHIEDCEICLDKSRYLGVTDYELEIEYQDRQTLEELLEFIRKKADLGEDVAFSGKRSRFMRVLAVKQKRKDG